MRDFDIPVLRSFLLIAGGKNFAEAASLMGRSASAITQQIKKLEDDLGAKVFRRTTHHVVLTADGERLIYHAKRLLQLHDEAVAALIHAPEQRLRVGLTQDLAESVMPSLSGVFRHQHRDVSLEIHVDGTDNLIARVRRQQLDLAIAERRDDATNQGKVISLPIVWLGVPGFDVGSSERLAIAMLVTPCQFRSAALGALSSLGRCADIQYTSPSLHDVLTYCKWGNALTVRTPLVLNDTGLADVGKRLGLPRLPTAHYCWYSNLPDPRKIDEDLLTFVKTQLSTLVRAPYAERNVSNEAIFT